MAKYASSLTELVGRTPLFRPERSLKNPRIPRMNIACPRAVLERVLLQLARAAAKARGDA
jgi:hypothetical protein